MGYLGAGDGPMQVRIYPPSSGRSRAAAICQAHDVDSRCTFDN
jgi:hypothetical protein